MHIDHPHLEASRNGLVVNCKALNTFCCFILKSVSNLHPQLRHSTVERVRCCKVLHISFLWLGTQVLANYNPQKALRSKPLFKSSCLPFSSSVLVSLLYAACPCSRSLSSHAVEQVVSNRCRVKHSLEVCFFMAGSREAPCEASQSTTVHMIACTVNLHGLSVSL